jgi:hypothetical protein
VSGKRLPRPEPTPQDSTSKPRRGPAVHVTVQHSPDPVDLNAFAEAYARVVQRIATDHPEALSHVG